MNKIHSHNSSAVSFRAVLALSFVLKVLLKMAVKTIVHTIE